MRFYSDGYFEIINKGSECYALGTPNGSLDLYYDGVKTFATKAGGIGVHDNDDDDPHVWFFSDIGTDHGKVGFPSGNFQVVDNINSDTMIFGNANGSVELYYMVSCSG